MWSRVSRLVSAALLAATALPALASAGAAPQWLALRVNGVEQEQMVPAWPLAGGYALPVDVWTSLQLQLPATAPTWIDGRAWQPLAAVPGLRWDLDAATQTLQIDAPAAAFDGLRHGFDAPAIEPTPAEAFGAWLNYDGYAERSGAQGGRTAQALLDLAGFAGGGAFRATGIVRDGPMLARWTRLDTGVSFDDPRSLSVWRLGDAVSQAGAWGRALRFGGVQWTTDFSLRPGFQSFPLPALQGEAALPSTLDLYVDNVRRAQLPLPAGRFDLAGIPVVTGQGELRLVVRDLLGREQVIVQSYHANAALLRPGLRQRSFEVGRERLDYGLASGRYGAAFASVTDREGIDPGFTREWRAEAQSGHVAAGATGLWLWPAAGTLQVSAAASGNHRRSGALLAATFDRQAFDWSGSLRIEAASRGFWQLGQGEAGPVRRTVIASAGRAWGRVSVGASALRQWRWTQAPASLLSLSVASEIGRWGTLAVTMLHDRRNGSGVAFALSRMLDARSAASVSVSRTSNGPVQPGAQWQRQPIDGEPLGLRLSAEGGSAQRGAAEATLDTPAAALRAGAASSPGGGQWHAGASGALAWLGDSVHALRRIEGSVALVETPGFPGVPVLLDQREIARTDARGRALVAGLRGYEPNRIGIDPSALPFDAEVDALEVVVLPPARSGVRVAIPVRQRRAATLRLVHPDGTPLPPGTLVNAQARGAHSSPVGFEGRVFVAGLEARTTLVAALPGRQCSTELVWPEASDDLPDFGTVVCR